MALPSFPDLQERTLLLTGITSGIGRALLPLLLRQGLRIVAVSLGRPEMEAAAHEACAVAGVEPGQISFFECDLADPQAVAACGEAIAGSVEQLDFIVHNAGIDPRHRFEKEGDAFWERVFQVNFFAAVALTRRLLPLVRQSPQGRIVFTGSVLDPLGGACVTAYAASKGALATLTRSLAHELKGSGVTVNAILPGAITVEKEGGNRASDERIIHWQSIPRRLTPHDLFGPLALFLSEAGGGITGQTLAVDGGILHPLADPALQGGKLAP